MKFERSQILKTNHIPASVYHFFSIFSDIFSSGSPASVQRKPIFNILYQANANGFSAYGNSIFWVRAILLLLEIISVIQR